MPPVDIRPLKQQLRSAAKNWRSSISSNEKQRLDNKIFQRVTRLREYAQCKTLLTYVSKPIEVDTLRLIDRAMSDGKQVAVPKCVEGTRRMEFYIIHSISDLAAQAFGVLEPIPEKCERLTDFRKCLCLVPALAYDREGFRLGYGGGYYDRFLSRFYGPKIGIIYSHDVHNRLWHGRYDVPVDLIVTEYHLYVCKKNPLQRHLRLAKK